MASDVIRMRLHLRRIRALSHTHPVAPGLNLTSRDTDTPPTHHTH